MSKKKEMREPIMKINRKEIKKAAKTAFRHNYLACVAVCFIMVFIAGEYTSTTTSIASYDNANVADLRFSVEEKKEIVKDIIDNDLTIQTANEKYGIENEDTVKKWIDAYKKYGMEGLNSKEVTFFGTTEENDSQSLSHLLNLGSVKSVMENSVNRKLIKLSTTATAYLDGMTKGRGYKMKFVEFLANLFVRESSFNAIMYIANILFGLAFSVFVTNVLRICELRFFLENKYYKKTKIGRLGFLFRERTLHPAKTMFVKDMLIWASVFTVIGYPILSYSYAMVPFILAENPNIKTKKALKLSRHMMKGYKRQLFLTEISLFGWEILSALSFGLVGILFLNPYKTAIESEFYLLMRKRAIENNFEFSDELNDEYLDIDFLEKTLKENAQKNGKNPDSVNYQPVYKCTTDENTEIILTLGDLREFERYPGLDFSKNSHFSRITKKKIIHRDYHRDYSIMSYILMFFTFAFIGWAWEVLIHIVEDGVFVNRGTMFGPWLPIYGFGGVCGVILLKKFIDRYVLTFFLVTGICAVVEYSTSWYLETFKHMKYWDYTGYFCNINGRICLEGILIFGFAGCAGIYILAPFLDDIIMKINIKIRFAVCCVLLLLFSADLVYSKANPNQGKGITDYTYSITEISQISTLDKIQ